MPRGRVSEKTSSLINNNLSSIIKEYLRPDTEFWDSSKTLKVLAEEEYFKCDDEVVWPECLQKMMSDGRTNLKDMDKIQCIIVYKYQELYMYNSLVALTFSSLYFADLKIYVWKNFFFYFLLINGKFMYKVFKNTSD